jgi:hypothetical protein
MEEEEKRIKDKNALDCFLNNSQGRPLSDVLPSQRRGKEGE